MSMENSSSLLSWGQAFEEHPIAQTRAIEKQLRADIAHNKQKLRNLVGGSYRDLLTTAEQIVALDSKTSKVDGQISELGRNCRPKQYVAPQAGVSVVQTSVAQLSLLHRCASCIVSCLKAGQVILAAKLLAISRLLHTSLSKQEHQAKILDNILDQLSRSRRRLLRHIDRRLDNAEIGQSELTEIVSAFCLATSSSCDDALHHLQRRRLGQIHRSAQGEHGDHQHTAKTFKYYIDSLRTTQLLLAQDVPQALQRLQRTAILQDADVLQLEHLHLGLLQTLVPGEIQNFTPYIKKGTLSEHEGKALLKKWSEEAFGAINSQLTSHLESLDNISSALQLREELLSAWLQSCFSTPAHAQVFDTLRKTLNEHIETLIQTQVSALSNIATHIVQSSKDGHSSAPPKDSAMHTPTPTIWSPPLATFPLTRGAQPFLTQLKTAHLGCTPPLHDISTSLSTWCRTITMLRDSLTSLRKTRWQDSLEEPDDPDDTTAQQILHKLSTTDPTTYTATLTTSLSGALSAFQTLLATAAQSHTAAATGAREALFLLRAIRDASLLLPTAFPASEPPSLSHVESAIPHLHALLAADVTRRLAAAMEGPARQQTATATPTSAPASASATQHLPNNLPSPTAFKTLRTLCRIMLEVGGTDTWTGDAVAAVRREVRARVVDGWVGEEGSGGEGRRVKEGVDESSTGETPGSSSPSHYRCYIRNSFDAIYLLTALGGEAKEVATEAGVRKAAVEYWGRTRLLFGVLDP